MLVKVGTEAEEKREENKRKHKKAHLFFGKAYRKNTFAAV